MHLLSVKWLRWLTSVLFLVAFIFALFLCLLPYILEKYVVPDVMASAGIREYRVSIHRVDPWRTALSLSILHEGSEVLFIDSLRMSYSPISLMSGTINSAQLSGLYVKSFYRDGTFSVAGLTDGTTGNQVGSSSNETSPWPIRLPFTIGSIEIRHCRIEVLAGARVYFLPLSIQAKMTTEKGIDDQGFVLKKLVGNFEIALGEKWAAGKFRIVSQDDLLKVSVSFRDLLIASLPLMDQLKGMQAGGRCSADMDFYLMPGGDGLREGELTVRMSGPLMKAGILGIESVDSDNPVVLKAFLKGNEWSYSLSGGRITDGAHWGTCVLHGGLGLEGGGGRAKGSLNCTISGKDLVENGREGRPTRFRLEYSADFEGMEKIHVDMKGELEPHVLRKMASADVTTTNCDGAQFDWLDLLSKTRSPKIKISGGIDIQADSMEFWGSVPGVDGVISGTEFKFSEIGIRGRGRSLDNAPWMIRGQVFFSGGIIKYADLGMTAREISGRIPFTLPINQEGTLKGEFHVERVASQGVDLGGMNVSLLKRSDGYVWNGFIDTPFFPDSKLLFSGNITEGCEEGWKAVTGFKLPLGPIAFARIRPLLPALRDMDVSAKLLLKGRISADRCGVAGSMLCVLQDGLITDKKNGLEVKGINIRLKMDDLPKFVTGPSQSASFDSLSTGRLELKNGSLKFRLDHPASITVESLGFDWCGGRVHGGNIHLSPSSSEFSAVFYCDRLRFAELLGQLGGIEAEGDGTLSGRIPISYSRGRIFFEEGFLFSSPGDAGVISFVSEDSLISGLTKAGGQYGQLDFVAAALKDFQYNWTKLLFKTEGDQLKLTMKLDGRPAKPLPFRYDRTSGRMVRIAPDSKGGIMQPLLLDINFNLPLDDIFRYGMRLKDIVN